MNENNEYNNIKIGRDEDGTIIFLQSIEGKGEESTRVITSFAPNSKKESKYVNKNIGSVKAISQTLVRLGIDWAINEYLKSIMRKTNFLHWDGWIALSKAIDNISEDKTIKENQKIDNITSGLAIIKSMDNNKTSKNLVNKLLLKCSNEFNEYPKGWNRLFNALKINYKSGEYNENVETLLNTANDMQLDDWKSKFYTYIFDAYLKIESMKDKDYINRNKGVLRKLYYLLDHLDSIMIHLNPGDENRKIANYVSNLVDNGILSDRELRAFNNIAVSSRGLKGYDETKVKTIIMQICDNLKDVTTRSKIKNILNTAQTKLSTDIENWNVLFDLLSIAFVKESKSKALDVVLNMIEIYEYRIAEDGNPRGKFEEMYNKTSNSGTGIGDMFMGDDSGFLPLDEDKKDDHKIIRKLKKALNLRRDKHKGRKVRKKRKIR